MYGLEYCCFVVREIYTGLHSTIELSLEFQRKSKLVMNMFSNLGWRK
jgi:hypothetical protein